MGFYSKGLSRRSAIALAAGLATGVLPDWGGIAQAVAPFPAKFKNEGKHGGEPVSATEDLMRQHSLLRISSTSTQNWRNACKGTRATLTP